MGYTGNAIYTTGANVQIQFTASGGTPPYTFAFSPETVVPLGLSIDLNSGIVSGYIADGAYPITVIASDTLGQVGVDSLVIYMGVSSLTLTETLPGMCVPAPYSFNIQATGGVPPYTFSLFEGTLPLGVELGADGLLSGTPTVAGTYTFTIHVVDAA